MPRTDENWRMLEGRDVLGNSRARVGIAKLGLISLKGLGLIVAAMLTAALFSDREPRRDNALRQVLPGEPGSGNLSLAVSPDGARIATTESRGHLALWHTDDGWWSEERLRVGGFAQTAVFSPDGRFLASGGACLALWELGSRGANQFRRLPVTGVQALAFSPDSNFLAMTFERNGNIILWDLAEGRKRAILPSGVPCILSVAFSPDGRYVAAGGNADIALLTVWNVNTRERALRIDGEFGAVRSLAFSRDGASIATTGAYERAVRLWDVKSGRLLRSFSGHEMGTNSLAFSPDGTILATVGNDGMGRLWKVATGELQAILDGQSMALENVAFSPDGVFLVATAIDDNDIRLWDVTEKRRAENRDAVSGTKTATPRLFTTFGRAGMRYRTWRQIIRETRRGLTPHFWNAGARSRTSGIATFRRMKRPMLTLSPRPSARAQQCDRVPAWSPRLTAWPRVRRRQSLCPTNYFGRATPTSAERLQT
jgi:dipeptidyl aminopeptidase/acylaminoacyl peptidase